MDTFYHGLLTDVGHRLVELENAADILRFSFVAQNSISHLDLQQQEERLYFRHDVNSFGFQRYSVLKLDIQYPKYVINTEEKCRKILSRTRDFLYRFHLDLAEKRECSLKDGPESQNRQSDYDSQHIGKIIVHPNFHFTVLANLVKEAVKRSDKKLKLIKWLVTFDAVAEDVFLNNQNALYFAKYMYSEVTESAFVRAFLKKLDFHSWMRHNDRPKILEFFLYHMVQNESTFAHNRVFKHELIEVCINRLHFLNIAPLLKYQDAHRVPLRYPIWFNDFDYIEREDMIRDALREAEKRMSPKRFYLLMQLLYVFFKSPTKPAAECLRLLWNSLPDAFFSFEEIEMALQTGLGAETVRDVYNFYSGAVGVFHERVEPRSLKHLSRPAVRRMLWESCCWIPDGIKLTGMPRVLQSFLNLEAEFCH